jgi:hypothetical protein
MISQAVHKLLTQSSDSKAVAIRSVLATYDFGSGVSPAIFTPHKMVPDDAATPYIVISEVSGVADHGCRTFSGGTYTVDIVIAGKKDFSDKIIRDAAWLIWKLLDRSNLDAYLNTSPFYLETWGVNAAMPQSLMDSDGFPEFVIRLSVRVMRTSNSN